MSTNMEYMKKARLEINDVPLDLSLKKSLPILIHSTNEKGNNKIQEILSPVNNKLNDNNTIPRVIPSPFNISERFLNLEYSLSQKLVCLNFSSPVKYVYNPIEYAFQVHAMYVHKYCNTTKKILFLGMNPGPWGMSQTGVPFGEVNIVKDWLKLYGYIGKPSQEQPDRQITGFNCTRSEISGRRFWNLFREVCNDNPENFFKHAYLHNYCPIALMDVGGRNITPADLKGPEQKILFTICDEALVAAVKLLNVETIVGIGRFSERRAQSVVKVAGLDTKVLCIPHPSPRSVGNENWNEKAKLKLHDLQLLEYFSN